MPQFQTPGVYEDAKDKVLKAANKANRVDKVAFMSGSMGSRSPYDIKEYSQRIEKAREEGASYYLTALPRNAYIESMKRFAKEIIPSFK